MDPPIKHRPKSAPVITNAYVQNKREEECLCVKLDSMHYQHHADLIRWRQTVDQVMRKRQDLLIQRAVTPRSTVEHVMEQIQTLKKERRSTGTTRYKLPRSTELEGGMYVHSKWPSIASSPNVVNVTGFGVKGKSAAETRVERTSPVMDIQKIKPINPMQKAPGSSEQSGARKPRATSSLRRKPNSCMESLTYKELGGIARLENISKRETERQKQQMLLEKQQLNKTQDSALQQKIDTFLNKFK